MVGVRPCTFGPLSLMASVASRTDDRSKAGSAPGGQGMASDSASSRLKTVRAFRAKVASPL
jgi:hypothetical protein